LSGVYVCFAGAGAFGAGFGAGAPAKQTYTPPKQQPSYGPPAKPQAPARPTKYNPPKYNAPKKPTYNAPKKPTYKAPKKPTYNAPKKPTTYNAPKKPTYKAPPPKKPTYNPPPPKKQVYSQPKPQKPKYRPQPPPKPKQNYQASTYRAPKKQAPVYVPAPKAYHKPPIIIYQGVAPPVHVYEKSAATTSYAQAKSSSVVNSAQYKKVPVPTKQKAQSKSDKQDLAVSGSNTVSVKVSPSAGSNQKTSLQIDPRTPTSKKRANPIPAQSRSDYIRLLTASSSKAADFESAVVSASVSVSSTDRHAKTPGGERRREKLTKGTVEDIDPKSRR
jgi:hypothetical protein